MNIKKYLTGIENVLLKIWKDPVWSKVIASAIIFIIATIWTRYSNYTLSDVYNFILRVFTTPFPLYFTLSIVGLYFLIRFSIAFFKPKEHPIWNEQIGNYKFRELYSILQRQNFPIQTLGMRYSGQQAPKDDLLTLFHSYITFLNMGVTLDGPDNDGGYLYGVLCPKLMSYGLVDKIESKGKYDITEIRYQTSELGHKFFSLLEKIIHLQKKDGNTMPTQEDTAK